MKKVHLHEVKLIDGILHQGEIIDNDKKTDRKYDCQRMA